MNNENIKFSEFVPYPHKEFLEKIIKWAQSDIRICAVAIGGSYLSGQMDEYSDLDLIIAVEDKYYDRVMESRKEIASSMGALLSSFTGEHVGEPRLLICLYNNPLLHVDLKFIKIEEIAERVEDPVILWERDNRFSEIINNSKASFPTPDPQWIEDRFWIWVHYIAAKIGRGEIFEAVEGLGYMRFKVLGPISLISAGKRPSGVRKLEFEVPEYQNELSNTIASYDRVSCINALKKSIELYKKLCKNDKKILNRTEAEHAVIEYLDEIESKIKS